MADVAASANDPIFLNHHAMVDCIFETWLQKNPDAQYPVNNDIRKGHRQTDYIVPFFPLYTHGDMFSTAEMFGYRCTIQSDKSGLPSWAIILISVVVPVVGLGLIMFCLVIVCIKMNICSCKCNKLRAYIRGYGGLDGANSDKTASPLEQSA